MDTIRGALVAHHTIVGRARHVFIVMMDIIWKARCVFLTNVNAIMVSLQMGQSVLRMIV